jgi:hypothetical protein
MNDEKDSDGVRGPVLAVIALAILLPLAASVVGSVTDGGPRDEEPFLARPAPEYEACVRDVEYMRYHHWEFLNEIREAAVRHGRRGDVSLDSCRQCHPDRERFCNRCHGAVNLQPDCWGCHYYPATPEAAALEAALRRSDRPAPTARSTGGEARDG